MTYSRRDVHFRKFPDRSAEFLLDVTDAVEWGKPEHISTCPRIDMQATAARVSPAERPLRREIREGGSFGGRRRERVEGEQDVQQHRVRYLLGIECVSLVSII